MKENELKRYVLLDNTMIVDRNKLDHTPHGKDYLMLSILERIANDDTENLCRQLVKTSDNILDLAEVGDCVESAFGGIGAVMEFLEQEGKSKRYRKYGSNDFCYLENPCNIALWKRNGNTMTRYEVER